MVNRVALIWKTIAKIWAFITIIISLVIAFAMGKGSYGFKTGFLVFIIACISQFIIILIMYTIGEITQLLQNINNTNNEFINLLSGQKNVNNSIPNQVSLPNIGPDLKNSYKICTNCGAKIYKNSLSCPQCGVYEGNSKIQSRMTLCKYCGREYDINLKECSYCGTRNT